MSKARGSGVAAASVAPFRAALGACLAEEAEPLDAAPPLEIDLQLTLSQVSRALVTELDGFSPWGRGNTPPLFAAHGVSVAGSPRARRKYASAASPRTSPALLRTIEGASTYL